MEITVLQWNVWFQEEIENVLQFARQQKADIFCLQELTKSFPGQSKENTWEFLAQELMYEYHYQDMPITTTDSMWYQANAIFSRFPISTKKTAWINEPKSNGGSHDQYRSYIEVALDLGDKVLNVGTTQMSYTNYRLTKAKRLEFEKLKSMLKNHNNRYVFTADLNDLPNTGVTPKITKLLKHSGPDYSQNTWTTKPVTYDGFEYNSLDRRLDYIFATPDIAVTSSEIIQTDISDHLPILTKFRLSS